ncbi:hypothetical protein ASE34_13315 [Microbacterium sp. Root280D1]|nr:hypothetical protein ASE34_13315 [Microbacterium sp. Root280D1]
MASVAMTVRYPRETSSSANLAQPSLPKGPDDGSGVGCSGTDASASFGGRVVVMVRLAARLL